ncbi:bifunctional 4-hydroxy-3-methylbut-2-enyl diphosphate reductase/30S ribosomal protein S1 [Peptoniphilus equinus]|uniref:4-hydroxy-3-methylbut-2-enyl diphosphate reductase n=1 Tax=Peptoniphilus equinus TaxID=3016343 RepID=A0ABY7QWY6_9FIRM|nr:bifunctional 4-hydroxy-3-methylbut-2-enyl diphosphate reductase/30S ribosomal protein S1 [Peptoniphilus equinus]WBW50609.1 bifunctional 4-hydroxy-3-methylbut-2-enyl diphosphate reductase/30S ribosomal protein S1 [Peptoniphilus equinus]
MEWMTIKVLVAEHAGFCGGVKRAVTMAMEAAGPGVYSFGDLVHNDLVNSALADRGVQSLGTESVTDSRIIIRSHGIHRKQREQFIADHNTIVDCVCPKVSKIYDIVAAHYTQGYQIIIFGDADHPEVQSINSYADDQGIIIGGDMDVSRVVLQKSILVSQTTNIEEKFEILANLLKKILNDDILVYNTICSATRLRQLATAELAKQVDVMLVLGGKKSSNTRKLYDIASKYCDTVYLLESIDDFKFNIKNFVKIGITAGASTPSSVIEEAVSRMEKFDNNEMMEAIENSFKRIRRGEVVEGEVLFVNDSEVMVNIGYRSDGIISREELSNDPDVKPEDLFKPGDSINVFIMKMDDGDGNVVLSYKRVESLKVWDEVEALFNNKENVTVTVKSVVKGGLTADLKGLNAFIPASHASVRFQRDLSKYVGQEFVCEIIDFDKFKRKIVLSRKNVEAVEQETKRKEVYENLHEGDVITGTVQRLTNFGAFVDVGGVDGLIHISELSWNRVKHPSDVVEPGQEVEVEVLSLDEEKNRIALGLKQTTKKPWDVFKETAGIGDVVEGKVVNILDFGAFVRLDSGVDGLLHVSQISKEHVEKPSDKLAIGDAVTVKITDIDEENKKISLSIKALTEDSEPEEAKEEVKPVVQDKPRKPRKKPQPKVEYTEATEESNINTGLADLLGGLKLDDMDDTEESTEE